MILKDCLEKVIDNRGRNPKYYDNEAYPVIDNIMIKNNYHPNIKEATRFIDQDTHDNFLRGYLEPNIPIMTLVGGGIGNVSLSIDEKSVIVQNTIGFKPKSEILDSIYLYYWFLYKHNELIQFNRGSGQPSIRKTDIENMDIDIKNINYQKKVSKILSKIDEKIALNNKINNNLYDIANTMIDGEFKNNEFIKLNEVIKFIKGKKPSDISIYKKDGYIKYLTIACLNNQETTYANSNKMIFTKSDVLMVMDGASSGNVYYSTEGIVGSTLSKIETKNNDFISEYLYFCLKKYSKDIQEKTTGSAIPHTDKEFVGNLNIPIIEKRKQTKYASFINKIIEINNQNEILSQLRDTLLPRLMNGEINLDNIEI